MNSLKNALSCEVFNCLISAKVDSFKTILLGDYVQLQNVTHLSSEQVQFVVKTAADIFLRKHLTPSSGLRPINHLSTRCKEIDQVTNGGIAINGLNEIFGESGVGKTQFCLQLALSVQCPVEQGGLGKGCVYICSDGIFPSKRLQQMIKIFHVTYDFSRNIYFSDNIFIKHAANYSQLHRCIFVELPKLLQSINIGLIVIDSIAGIFRSEYQENVCPQRALQCAELSRQLNKFSDQYHLAIICTNQVTNNFDEMMLVPCLGLTWSKWINYRYQMKRIGDSARQFETVFGSDSFSNKKCNFFVTINGIET